MGKYREAADPSVITYKGKYWMFASKSGGYWFSEDLKEWTFVESNDIPTEDYAPTALVMRDTIFFLASNPRDKAAVVYKTAHPETGKWEVADSLDIHSMIDPDLFLDDDGRLYFYWGCSDVNPIYGVELDPYSFKNISKIEGFFLADTAKHGWEVRGDYNRAFDEWVWVEGAWMNKFNGKYYLQYAVPGTAQKSYADGVYISDNPLGPFKLAEHNPFALKPEGYACGAGHGSTFSDSYGNLWHVGTISVSVKFKFERRLALYPAFLDEDGELYADTRYGDYPIIIPDKKINSADDIFPGWMLLSYKKPVEVSSAIPGYYAENMADEEIRSYWAAETGSDKEWCMVDLEHECDVYSIHVNFAEHDAHVRHREKGIKHRYTVEASTDKEKWEVIIDKSQSDSDCSHDYTQLNQKVKAQYIRVKNIEVPSGKFAVSGLRVFGKGNGSKPGIISGFDVKRLRRCASLNWSASDGATGYLIRYGIDEDKLYQSYMVYDTSGVQINLLSTYNDYFFTIEAFNENGITSSHIIKKN